MSGTLGAEAIVLGSGTSNGVPSLGVEYSDAFLANPKNHRTRPAVLIRGPEGNLLIDCPPELRLQLLREKVMMVDAVILTHTHADHLMGMDDLRSFYLRSRRPMPVYSYPRYQADVRRVFQYAFEEYPPGIEVPRFDLYDVEERMRLCGLPVETFQVMHGPWPVVGIRIGDFAYITDVSDIPPDSWKKLQRLETLILDGVRYQPHPYHYHFDKALEVAAQLGAKRTYLTHLSHDYDHDLVEAVLPEDVGLAYDGLRILL